MNLTQHAQRYRRARERAAAQVAPVRDALYAAIRDAHAAGQTVRGIAKVTGLSASRVGQIVLKKKGER